MACDNPLYNWSLGGSVPDKMAVIPTDSWPGDPERGRWLCGGAFALADGMVLELAGDYWEPEGVAESWLTAMHGFEWLRDLRALGGDAARRQARDMVLSWMKRYHNWDCFAWRGDVTGMRVGNWIALYDFFGASADDEVQDRFFESLMRQARHLARALPGALHGVALLHGVRGLVFAGIALPGRENWLEQGLDLLQAETAKQILPDGGHISRSPAQLVEALRIYTDIRAALRTAGYPVPPPVEHTIDRMAQALRFFRYADKGLALFHGTQEGDCGMLDCVLLKANAKGRVLRGLPQSGYERVTMGRSVLMVDTGAPPSYPHDHDAHAAPLAFEFMYGKERIFVACGAHPLDDDWRDALRATAAHNALSLDYRNACEIRNDGHLGRRPRTVTMNRDENNDACLIDGSHDGYVPVNGITHRRRLYLGDQGHDLRGEENLTCTVGLSKTVDVAVRFHLHPRVQVSLVKEGKEALLRLPGGAGWRFFHSGGVMQLENSIYMGQGTRPRKTKQIVIYGQMDTDHAAIKWALQREGV
ncbi:MAG: heparinase II/III family protein [Alphaproteobacteria bacterium]|nr:heparinase II/III family protein [Alphaproteobacteria bacterium]